MGQWLQKTFPFINSTIFTIFLFFIVIFLILLIIFQNIHFIKVKKNIRKDAAKRSRAVRDGQMAEQIAPFLPDFPCRAEDARFLGKPVDFIAFPGLEEKNQVDEILLIEVKTGSSALSNREKEVLQAVKDGRVRYIQYRIN